jgi:L-ascorbate oxidase
MRFLIAKDLICNEVNSSASCGPGKPYCACIYTYEFELNEVVEFVIVDEGFTFQSNHPMHLHGHRFAVMGIEKVTF